MTTGTHTSHAAVSLDGVVKRFSKSRGLRDYLPPFRRERLTVLDELSLAIAPGEVLGLVGVNGCGKTTMLRIICGLLSADGGRVQVLGRDPLADRSEIARDLGVILPNERGFFWRLSVRRNLEFFASLQDLDGAEAATAVERACREVGMGEKIDTPFRDLSDGMKQRIAVARGLLRPAKLLLVDEATRSLDPAGAERIRTLLRARAERDNAAVLIVSHNLDEVAQVCDRMALLKDGRIALEGMAATVGTHIRELLDEQEARR